MTLRAGTWTVLFTDMVGSTDQRVRLGDVTVDELLREHDAIVTRALSTHGGELVKGTGDGALCAFGGAANALAAAVAIQQRLERRNRDAPEQLRLRVGMSMGDFVLEDGDLLGLAAHEAARVCESAEAGEILVSDVVRTVAGSRAGCELVPRGELELKGLPQPVMLWRVAWEPAPEPEQLPLPPLLESRQTLAFSGRTGELATVLDAWKGASGGSRRCVVVSGEPGIGKTRLVAEAARAAHLDGAMVLYGQCDDELGVPFQPFAEALDCYLARADEVVLGRWPGDLARLAPQLSEQVRNLPPPLEADPESAQYRLFDAVASWLTALSAEQPVVVALDDLHWATKPTLLMLRHVVRTTDPARLLLVVTYRETDIGAEHPLTATLAFLHREPGVERITLGGLDADALGVLLEAAGYELDTAGLELRDTLASETNGNPFFVGQVLHHLAETKSMSRDEQGRWSTSPDLRTSGLPVSIREVISQRVARLGAQTQRAMSLAAVIGHHFDADVLAQVAELDEDTLIDLCDQAVTAALLTEADVPGRYTFAHALIEHALYDALSAGRRGRTHRTVAEALEKLCGDDPSERIGELAYHWAHATQPQNSAKAIAYAQLAGDRALALLAPDEALRYYRSALDLLDGAPADDPRRRAALLVGFGEAQRQTGDAEHRATLLAAGRLADDVDEIDTLVRAALSNNRGWNSVAGATDHERVELLTRAVTRLGDTDSPARARLLAMLCVERTWDTDFDERLSLATRAVDIARRTGDAAALVDAIRLSHESIAMPETLELRLGWNTEACDLAEDLGDPTARLHANDYRGYAATEAGDLVTLRTASVIFEAESERIGQPLNRWQIAYKRASQRMLEGDLDAAEQSATEGLTLGAAAGFPDDALTFFGAQLMVLRWMQGRINEMIPLIEQTVQDNPGLQIYRAALAFAKTFDEPHDEVRHLLDVEVPNDFPMFADSSWLAGQVLWAGAAARSRHRPAAMLLRKRLLPWHDQFATAHINVEGSVALYLGLLAHTLDRHDEGDQWFGQALAMHEAMEAPFFATWTQAAWADLLADRNQPGDAQRARTLAGAALRVATQRGYGYVEHDACLVLERIE